MTETTSTQTFFAKWKMYIGIVTTVLGLAAGIFVFDDRYAKAKTFNDAVNRAKLEVIQEMRSEVGRNRKAMVSNMQREADDLEYEMSILRAAAAEVPRYMVEKHRNLLRDIRELQQ